MRLLVTGANGFVGRHVVRTALERGHTVRGLVRSADSAAALQQACPGVETVLGDLRSRGDWTDALRDTDAVVHLAATKSGSFAQQFPGTVGATEVLLAAMADEGAADRIVHVSTLAAYDFDARERGSSFDEGVPLETAPETRDAYTHTKLYQERLVRDAAARGLRVTVVRPGAVWGADDLWDGACGHVAGPLSIALGDGVTSRFTYVENCAEAIVMAAETDSAVGAAFNVIDDDLPTQPQYASALRAHGVPVPRAVPVPFAVLHAVVALISWVNLRFTGDRLPLPGILSRRRLDSYYKPFRFENGHVKATLGWAPRYGFGDAVARATAATRQ